MQVVQHGVDIGIVPERPAVILGNGALNSLNGFLEEMLMAKTLVCEACPRAEDTNLGSTIAISTVCGGISSNI
jgi:hypothetical protein